MTFTARKSISPLDLDIRLSYFILFVIVCHITHTCCYLAQLWLSGPCVLLRSFYLLIVEIQQLLWGMLYLTNFSSWMLASLVGQRSPVTSTCAFAWDVLRLISWCSPAHSFLRYLLSREPQLEPSQVGSLSYLCLSWYELNGTLPPYHSLFSDRNKSEQSEFRGTRIIIWPATCYLSSLVGAALQSIMGRLSGKASHNVSD
jgi:hypothetical protein